MSSTVFDTTTSTAADGADVTYDPLDLYTLSPSQTTALALIPIPGSILSFVSSILIIRSIERKRRQSTRATVESNRGVLNHLNNTNNNSNDGDGDNSNNNRSRSSSSKDGGSRRHRRLTTNYTARRSGEKPGPYERIVFAMSCYDILFTVVLVWSPFLTPTGYWWPSPNHFGNENTCRFIATLFQFSIANIFYYGWLGVYFLLTIRFNVRKEVFARRFEGWIHGSTILYSVVTSSVGASVNFYDELRFFPGCWIDNYPKGCLGDTCVSPLIGWILSGIPVCIVTGSLIINYLTILWYVTTQYNRHSPPVTIATTTTMSQTVDESKTRRKSFDRLSSMFFPTNRRQQAHQQQQHQHQHSDDAPDNDNSPSDVPSRLTLSSSLHSEGRFTGTLNSTCQSSRVRLVSTQAYLYISTFFLTYTWFYILQLIEGFPDATTKHFPKYPIMILQAFFTPLAGFWNALVFFRPKYILLRRYHVRRYERRLQLRQLNTSLSVSSDDNNEDMVDIRLASRWKVMYWVLFGEEGPSLSRGSPFVQPNTPPTRVSRVLQYLKDLLFCHPSQGVRVSEESSKGRSRPSDDEKQRSIRTVSNNPLQGHSDAEDTVSKPRDTKAILAQENKFDHMENEDIHNKKNTFDFGGCDNNSDNDDDDDNSILSFSSILKD